MPKEKGNDKIHRVQIIHVYEADYSVLIGVTWHNLVQSLEARNTIHQGQVGGRADHDANTLTFMEEMKNEISYCSQKPLVNFVNDAALCYDCIIPNLANIIGRKKGLHRNIMFVHASTWEKA
eukprot:5335119-Ditylum_brightwellii.AAC.1